MIDLANEELMSLSQAAKLLPGRTSDKVSPSTVWRWITRGCTDKDGKVVKLEAVRVGAYFCTSRQSITRFIEAINGPCEGPAPVIRAPTTRKKASEQAAAKLHAAGI
jgi:Protein of unknown function (DUF1580)